MISIMRNSLP